MFDITGSKGESSVLDNNHSGHLFIRLTSQQLAVTTTVLDSVVCRRQIDKYGTNILLNLHRIIVDVLCFSFKLLFRDTTEIQSWLRGPPSGEAP